MCSIGCSPYKTPTFQMPVKQANVGVFSSCLDQPDQKNQLNGNIINFTCFDTVSDVTRHRYRYTRSPLDIVAQLHKNTQLHALNIHVTRQRV